MYMQLLNFLKGNLKRKRNYLLAHSEIVKNITWLFADKFFRMGMGLFVGVWVARYLGPQDYGLLSYAQAVIALFSVIATLGLDGIVVRKIVQNSECSNTVLGTTFILKFAGGIILLFVSIFFSFMVDCERITTQLIAIIAIGNIFQSFDTIDLWFQSKVQSKYTVWSKNLAFLLISIGKIICILNKSTIFAFAILGVLEIIVGACGLIFSYLVNKQKLLDWKFSFECAKSLLKKKLDTYYFWLCCYNIYEN